MKNIFVPIILLISSMGELSAQMCPGGGTQFSNSVTVAQSWFYGCSTGTSCNGGTEFDNRAPCEPTTAMDACAPTPTCTTNINGSDIWFNFFAEGPTASIKVIQNVSFVIAIQAFSGGPTCGSLTQIGCVVSDGPSSGVTLNLSGLVKDQKYFFRVFGTSPPASQRTGTYCFCGSSGLGSVALPVVLTNFKAQVQKKNNVVLSWTTVSETNNRYFDIEQSNDGINFSFVSRIAGKGTTTHTSDYTITDSYVTPGTRYYRLKQVDLDGKATYSKVVSVLIENTNRLNLTQQSDQLIVEAEENMKVALLNSSGRLINFFTLKPGRNNISLSNLPAGMYILQSKEDAGSWKFNKTY